MEHQIGEGDPHLNRTVVDIGVGRADAREHVPDHVERILKGCGPEKDPGETDQKEGHRDGNDTQQGVQLPVSLEPGAFFVPWEKALYDLKRAVDASPEHVIPTCAVPQAADQEGDHDIKSMTDTAHPVAAQRDIDVVSQPAGEGHVPSSPEILDGGRKIGGTEVGRQAYPQDAGGAESDVRIP